MGRVIIHHHCLLGSLRDKGRKKTLTLLVYFMLDGVAELGRVIIHHHCLLGSLRDKGRKKTLTLLVYFGVLDCLLGVKAGKKHSHFWSNALV